MRTRSCRTRSATVTAIRPMLKGGTRCTSPPGKVSIQPSSTPKSHLEVDTQHCPQLDVSVDREWPDFKLARAVAIDGIVVDAAGKPVQGRGNPRGQAEPDGVRGPRA